MKNAIRTAFLVVPLLAPLSAGAQDSLGIAVVVNDDVISLRDLASRIDLVLASSQLKDTGETRNRILPQVLRKMIDERLQLQEAERLNVRVTDEDIAEAMKQIETQNNLPEGGLDAYLDRLGIDRTTLVGQVTADLAWMKVVTQRIRPTIDIGEEEVDEVMERVRASRGQPESHVSDIFLAVDGEEREGEMRRLAERLVLQVRSGTSFEALARQFSNSADAAIGGDIGWVRQGQLDPALDAALRRMRPGEVAGPIRTVDGFHILLLHERRAIVSEGAEETHLELRQVFLPLKATASVEEVATVAALAKTVGEVADGCADLERIGTELRTPLSGSLGRVRLADLPPSFRPVVSSLPIGEAGNPIRTEEGLIVLMVCDREEPTVSETTRERVANSILLERLSLLAQRYLRDLRREAFIDMRI